MMNSERRFLIFLMLAMVILTGHMMLTHWLNPPKPAPPKPPADQALNGDPKKLGDKPADPAVKTPPDEEKPTDDAVQSSQNFPARWAALGSIDPESNYRLLATLTSRGAAVERIELAENKYQDLDDPSGYIGHLALTEVEGGLLVNVVGPGVPAARAVPQQESAGAGLKQGDIIVAFSGSPTPTVSSFELLRSATKPNDQILIEVQRGDAGNRKNLTFTLTAVARPLEVVRPEFSVYKGKSELHPLSLLLSLAPGSIPAGKAVNAEAREQAAQKIASVMHESNWDLKHIDGDSPRIEFRLLLPLSLVKGLGVESPIEVVKKYRLVGVSESSAGTVARAYHLEFDVEIVNKGNAPINLSYELRGPTGLPLEGWWYSNKVGGTNDWSRFGARDVIWRPLHGAARIVSSASITSAAIKTEFKPHPLTSTETTELRYAGVDAQYFAAVLRARGDESQAHSFTHVDALPVNKGEAKDPAYSHRADNSFRLRSIAATLAPAESMVQKFDLFTGPKDRNLLSAYQLDELVHYGWWWWVSPAILALLRMFYALIGNYGIAIVLLTVVVRLCLFPISIRAVKDAEKMKLIQPELQKMREKYKNDNEKLMRAQQELFAKHNYNPLTGCLPLFLQLPIFAGLYRALTVDIALRQAPFIPGAMWCNNLAGPDKLFYWEPYIWTSLGGPLGWFGPYFNLLPIITVVLFLINQKMVLPPPTDEQQRMQQQVMLYTTMFMGVMFFKVPSGLCLYFIASSVWGIAERKFLLQSATHTPKNANK